MPKTRHLALRKHVSHQKGVTKRIDRAIIVAGAELFTEYLGHRGREVRNRNFLLLHPRAQTIGGFEVLAVGNTNRAAKLKRREDIAMQRIVR